MIPGRLPECSECYRMLTTYREISGSGFTKMRQEVRGEQSCGWFHRLEHHGMADNLAAIGADYLGRRDFSRLLAEIKIRPAHVHRPFGKSDGTLCVFWKTLKEF